VIDIYPSQFSVFPGETFGIHISHPSSGCVLEFVRFGSPDERVAMIAVDHTGLELTHGVPTRDWGWPRHDIVVSPGWRPGVYRIRLLADATDPHRGHIASAVIVVRDPQPHTASILYKLPFASYGAYNSTGYGSLYAEAVWSHSSPEGFKATLRRPGVGSGGLVAISDPPDSHSPGSRRQTIDHWDAPFIRWLERNGYPVHYCTDVDLHRDPALLASYSLMLSVGHDEYWSDTMRSAVERHIAAGGNVAFLSGNIAWWTIEFVEDETAIVCTKLDPQRPVKPRGGLAFAVDPPTSLAGVSTLTGGGWWDGRRDPLGYTVRDATHWCFDGTDLTDGSVFGADDAVPVIGYEVDGAPFIERNGFPVPAANAGIPDTFSILAVAELIPPWVAREANAAATMGVYTSDRGGIVFQAATTDWVLNLLENETTATITRNVLDRLQLPSVPLLGPYPAIGGRCVAIEGGHASFHVDTSRLGARPDVRYKWQLPDGTISVSHTPAVRARVSSPVRPLTVSVTVMDDDDRPLAFGTNTVLPLTHDEAARFEIAALIQELALPADPATAQFDPLENHAVRPPSVITTGLPWIRRRALRLVELADALIAQRSAHPQWGREYFEMSPFDDPKLADPRVASPDERRPVQR
jgi:hypothetical protein